MATSTSSAKPSLFQRFGALKRKTILFSLGVLLLSVSGWGYFHYTTQSSSGNRIIDGSAILSAFPFADDLGIIQSVKTIHIPGIEAPYNPCIIEHGDHFLLFFRYDVPTKVKVPTINLKLPFYTRLGCIELDQTLSPINEPITLDTGSDFSEDPRVIKIGDQLFLSYNDLTNNPAFNRTIRLAALDPKTFKVRYSLNLDLGLKPVEKNWIPFEHVDEKGIPKLHFVYGIFPHSILRLDDPTQNQLSLIRSKNLDSLQELPWPERKWGKFRGGTPAKLIDGQYLTFFHTSFKERRRNKAGNKTYYIMGAYTFEPEAPFRIKAMSSMPILYKSMYTTPISNTAEHGKYCVFPAGFAVQTVDGKEMIHVSSGENDCAIKIITFEKQALLNSLRLIPQIAHEEKDQLRGIPIKN